MQIGLQTYDPNDEKLGIMWDILPADKTDVNFISRSLYGDSLTVNSGGLRYNTSYTIKITAFNQEYPNETRFGREIQFQTGLPPPSNGSIVILPNERVYAMQTFLNISIANWTSSST
jgi:hypothetical protein